MEIPRFILEECYLHGIEAYPEEACGLITESIDGCLKVYRMRNVMDEFHAREPEKYRMTNLNGYIIDPIEMLRLDKLDHRLRLIYHSHPDIDAYFSETDQEKALWDRKPIWPGLDYLVLSIKKGKPNGAILAVFSPERGEFDITRIE